MIFFESYFSYLYFIPSVSEIFFGKENGGLGGEYMKAVFKGYTDHSFTEKTNTESHFGILGKRQFCISLYVSFIIRLHYG